MSEVTGVPMVWARDFALIGGVTSLVAPLLGMGFGVSAAYVATATAAGAATGGALGAAMPTLLERVRGRVPLWVLALLGPVLGAAWGATVGATADVLSGTGMLQLSLITAGTAGAVQLGLTWFPYTFQTVRGGRRWPVVLGAMFVAPLAAFISIIAAISAATGGGTF